MRRRRKQAPGIEVTKRIKRGNEADKATVDELVPSPPSEPLAERIKIFRLSFLALGLLWLAFPPLGLAWLAWLAPLPLAWICLARKLPGRRPYRQLFVAGLLYWLATFYFIPIPHPALWLGWLVVSLYMACYTPLQIAATRSMMRNWRVPVWLAFPITWTGLEYFRCFFASGMAMVCLSHSQYKSPILIQVADLSGAYTLTFFMTLFSGAIGTLTWPLGRKLFRESEEISRPSWFAPAVAAIGAVAVVIIYGQYRLNEKVTTDSDRRANIGIIQTSEDVIFGMPTDDELTARMRNQERLTRGARAQFPDLDLVLWPESGFNPVYDLLGDLDSNRTAAWAELNCMEHWRGMTGYPFEFEQPLPMLTGALSFRPETDETFNAAIYLGADGTIKSRYFKNHLVMFGEYVPLMDLIPAIKKFSPIPNTTPGTVFEVIEVNGLKIAPSICFETTIPHLIRRQVNSLAANGSEPDLLVNLTNDGWFFGTSCLDLHLACNVFRAVELRRPHVVCANTGLSAQIDTCGRLLQVGPRRRESVMQAEVVAVERSSLYRVIGDFVPMVLLGICLVALVVAWRGRLRG